MLGKPAADLVDEIVDGAISAPIPDPPEWKDDPPPPRGVSAEEREAYAELNRGRLMELISEWILLMASQGLRERLTLFWHNHFVTSAAAFQGAPIAYRYLDLLRRHALGNFREFVRAVGLSPAMLIYLNGAQNKAGEPNENYARELLELFTMGITGPSGLPNYTDSRTPPGDVQEIARALTGWVVHRETHSAVFVRSRFDDSVKTIFGRTGNFGYDGVVDLVFERRRYETASFVCRKLYKEFIYEEPDEAFVELLAAEFLAEDFEIAPVVRALLKSPQFFDARIMGARIKSPVEVLLGQVVSTEISVSPEGLQQINRSLRRLTQSLLYPPSVAGWPGHQRWIDTTTLPLRWLESDALVAGRGSLYRSGIQSMARALTDPSWDLNGRRLSPFLLPTSVAEHLLAIPLEHAAIDDVAEEFAGDLDSNPIPEEVRVAPRHVQNLAKIFLAGSPWYEWTLDADGADILLHSFVRYVTRLPEYQLA